VTYTELMALSPLQRFWYKFTQFIKSIPSGLGKFFCAIGTGIKNFFVSVGKAIANYFVGFVKGDIITKLSYFIMGLGNACRGQVVKGLIFFAIEVLYILFMVFFGANFLGLFVNLEALVTQVELPGGFMGKPLVQDVYTHTSIEILLFGILVIMVSIAAIAIYFVSVKSARKCEEIVKAGGKPKTMKQEVKDLLDAKFHTTLLSLPIVLICVFVLLPLIFMIVMAFTNFEINHYNSFNWIGMENFGEIFSTSSGKGASMGMTFAKIVGWTLIWAVFATFSNYILGMVVALMINKKGIKLKKLWRTMFVMTIAVPQFVTLLLMAKMLGSDPNSPLNLIVSFLSGGTADPINLFSQANNGFLARLTVILVNIWVGIPYTILMTTGILMNIPEDLYESARIDGAGPFKSFTKITLPYMLFVTTPYLITTFIGNVNNFNVIYLITGGEPKVGEYKYAAGKTDLLITLLFKLSVDQKKYGLGAAIGILVFIVCATLSLVTFNMTKSAKNEEEFS